MPVIIRRPRAIVFDILGTASKSGFLERILFPFLKINLDNYISTHWGRKEFKTLYKRILDQSLEFHKQEPSTPIVLAYELPNSRASLINFINFVTENGINSTAVTSLRFKVWFEGYQQSKLRTPIYSDVPNQMKKWFAEGIKFYVFSNTWVEAQKALLRNTNHGDLTNLISGHYDNEFGSLLEADSWRRFCNEIKEQPQNVLFLTKSPLEGRAAADAGLGIVLVLTHRHNVKGVSHEDRARFPYVRTLNDLAWAEDTGTVSTSGAVHPITSGGGVPEPSSVSHSNQRRRTSSPVPTAVTVQTSAVSGAHGQPLVGSSSNVGHQNVGSATTTNATQTGNSSAHQ